MKSYVKPTIEFIELKPEERLACVTGGGCGGCCTSGGSSGPTLAYWWPCYLGSPIGLCNMINQGQKAGGHGGYGKGHNGGNIGGGPKGGHGGRGR